MTVFVEDYTQGIHELGALMDEAFTGLEQQRLGLLHSDFGSTKHVSGRRAAITIASASAASFGD